jgi:phosphatidylinositol glycan class W
MFTIKLWGVDILLWILFWISQNFVEEVSRRMVNLSYVLLILSINIMILASCLMVAMVTKPTENTILVALNQNGLAMFLLVRNVSFYIYFLQANISTGLVNLSMKTIYASDALAMTVLSLYLLFICGVAVYLLYKKITLKFW